MLEVGDRVGAILSADEKEVRFLGFGVYQGRQIPDKPMGFIKSIVGGDTWEEAVRNLREEFPEEKRSDEELLESLQDSNPRILLDSGKVVWGAECWWGAEEAVKKRMEGKNIVNVDIDRAREEAGL